MPRRFQVVESMLWQPPDGVDRDSVRFHIDGWAPDGHPLDIDGVMARRADVIAEWVEPDPQPA